MNNRIMGAGIAVAAIVLLVFVVFGTKNANKGREASKKDSIKELISENKLDEARTMLDKADKKDQDSNDMGKAYFELASSYEKNNEIVKARDIYNLILSRYQNLDNIAEVQEILGRLNKEILFSSVITDKDVLYEVEPGDTLSKIAKRFGTTIDLIKASNSLESDVIRVGSKLKVSKSRYKILIDKSQNLLTLLTDDEVVVKVYRVATGENNSTPVGAFTVINKIKDPVWYTQGAIVPAESPDNILGSRWIGLSVKGYGIHGTADPDSVGKQATSGCIRMLDHDVEELYAIIANGTEVTIVD
ncbi:MAG: L,D-transpeptidase family protein [Candidatus Omnitrophica bacterium]|nr:L,D-transpeptidase family protein [Candidatus Omnitrophota bacterium]